MTSWKRISQELSGFRCKNEKQFSTFFCVKDASFQLQASMCAELFSISGVGSLISFFGFKLRYNWDEIGFHEP